MYESFSRKIVNASDNLQDLGVDGKVILNGS
jgi:hypothetical protein